MAVLKIVDKPRIILMISNLVGEQVAKFLMERKENVVATFLPGNNQEFDVDKITAYKPDVIITCYWPYLLKPEIIRIPTYGCINFHPALLPKNRGWYPAVWEVLQGEKAGVTLHLIDEKADTGPIIAQAEFDIYETDTGGTIYDKSQLMMISLFKKVWVKLLEGGIILQRQDSTQGVYHSKKETNDLDEIQLDKYYKGKDLINLLRAKTFGDKSYAFYRKGGERYYVRVTITKEKK